MSNGFQSSNALQAAAFQAKYFRRRLMGMIASTPNTKIPAEHADQLAIEQTLARGESGGLLTREDAILLIGRARTGALLEAASSLRNRVKGRTISYSRKAFIPLTTFCRDRCGYCTFRRDPGEPGGRYMTPEDVIAAAETAQRAGCHELLFSLGDQPEVEFPEAREFLHTQGVKRTLEYLAAMTRLALEKTGLLPHSNPGLMGAADLAELKTSNASLGLMLENSSPRLMGRGQAHWRAPDKAPRKRLRTIEDAGRLEIPFTSGILFGIGETREERVDSLLAIRALHERYGHIQEVIVQNFRAKAATPMAAHPEPDMDEMLRTVAVARLVLGGDMNLQAPPNLSASDYPRLLDAGINDWGGISPVTPDFINPEAAWPHIATLGERTADAGFELRARLAVYPEFIEREGFLDDAVRPYVAALADTDGFAKTGD
ncbi:MAG: 7,8-didemethyl-8-hydroxy-5-deazariboflavin synthase CofG [Candidatus Acidiferrales bacterium]